jgi:putative ATP-binding cassette transporter
MMQDPASRAFVPFSTRPKVEITGRFWSLAGRFWTGEAAAKAWFYSLGLALALLLVLAVNIGVNRWQSALFNALEAKDAARAWSAAMLVPVLVLGGAGAGALVVYTRETLQVFWREYVVGALVGRWLHGHRYRSLQEEGREPPNPEYRIADDVKLALDPVVDFAIGFFSATLSAVAFVGILWTVGGSLTVTIGGAVWSIPAFMVIAAVIYGALMTAATILVGHPLVGAAARRYEAEARLRFDLTKVREHAETVRATDGVADAHAAIRATYADLVLRSRAIVRYHTRITWFTNGNGVLVPIFALVLATPKYLAGELSLGDLVSLGAAFHQTQNALSWMVDNFRQVATWYASAGRVVDMIEATAEAELATTVEAPSASSPRPAPAAS